MSSESKTVRVRVHGKVQGVFFRHSCRQRAHELGVRGWVRNCPDGTVEAVFSGPPADVDALVRWAHSGPPPATVTDVRVEQADDPGLSRFEVR